jgi:integrase
MPVRSSGRRIQESSKSTRKTVAVAAEQTRRRELERSYNALEDTRRERVRCVAEIAKEYLADYELRNPRSATSAKCALAPVVKILGKVLAVDVTAATVKAYQSTRLKAKYAPKTINEETGYLLRILGERGDFIRVKMRHQKTLKLKAGRQVARAFGPEEKKALISAAGTLRSPHIVPALMLALHLGLRDAEIRGLQWERVDLEKGIVTVGASKTEAGEGRTIPLNSEALAALTAHAKWYIGKFRETRPEWYLFPFGKPQPTDPTKPVTSFKAAWSKVRAVAHVSGRWHDNRHTFITDLAEGGEASDETIRDLAGHVSKQMLTHYSHIRMEAKRKAVASLTGAPKAEEPLEAGKRPSPKGVTQEVPTMERVN